MNPLSQEIPQQAKPKPDWEGPAMGSRLDTVFRVVLRIFEEVGVHTYGGSGSTSRSLWFRSALPSFTKS